MFLTRLPTTLAHLYLVGWLKMQNPLPSSCKEALLRAMPNVTSNEASYVVPGPMAFFVVTIH